jgi:hypothetical protein
MKPLGAFPPQPDPLNRPLPNLLCADTDNLFDLEHEAFPVTDFQGISDFLELVGLDYRFDLSHAGILNIAAPLAPAMPPGIETIVSSKSPDFAGRFPHGDL